MHLLSIQLHRGGPIGIKGHYGWDLSGNQDMIAGLLAHVEGAATGGGIQDSGYGRDQVSMTSD